MILKWPNGKLTTRLIISNNTTFPAVYENVWCPGKRSERKRQGRVSKYDELPIRTSPVTSFDASGDMATAVTGPLLPSRIPSSFKLPFSYLSRCVLLSQSKSNKTRTKRTVRNLQSFKRNRGGKKIKELKLTSPPTTTIPFDVAAIEVGAYLVVVNADFRFPFS